MAEKSTIDKIAALLRVDAPEKQIAAAIILGELKAKAPVAVDGMMAMLSTNQPTLQRHALDALAKVGAKRALPQVFPLLTARDADLREAARRAVVSVGDAVVPKVRERMAVVDPDERRALEAILAQLGGKEAFTALLAGLDASDEESARTAALKMRQQIRDADKKQRQNYRSQIERFLKQTKKRADQPVVAVAASIKMLGFLEDERAVPTLLEYAGDDKCNALVRQEAVIALRFAVKQRVDTSKVIDTLVKAGQAEDRSLAQTALITLGGLTIPTRHVAMFEQLVSHPEFERARYAMEQLGRQEGPDTAKVLVKVISEAERRRAELAVEVLEKRLDAVPALIAALLGTEDRDRTWMMRSVLREHAEFLTPAQRKKLLDAALARLKAGEPGWEAALDVARRADPEKAADQLRALAAALKKGRKPDRLQNVLRVLCRSDHATDADRYQLAALELGQSRLDTRPTARAGDPALQLFGELLRGGFDIAAALRKDRAIDLDKLYYLGFHFVEEQQPLGEELLDQVIEKAGRKKVGKMAKNKLQSAGLI